MIIRKIKLTDSQRLALEDGYQNGRTASYRKRCHIVLLKSEDRTAKDIAEIVNTNIQSVYNWLNRYETCGFKGYKPKQDKADPKS